MGSGAIFVRTQSVYPQRKIDYKKIMINNYYFLKSGKGERVSTKLFFEHLTIIEKVIFCYFIPPSARGGWIRTLKLRITS